MSTWTDAAREAVPCTPFCDEMRAAGLKGHLDVCRRQRNAALVTLAPHLAEQVAAAEKRGRVVAMPPAEHGTYRLFVGDWLRDRAAREADE